MASSFRPTTYYNTLTEFPIFLKLIFLQINWSNRCKNSSPSPPSKSVLTFYLFLPRFVLETLTSVTASSELPCPLTSGWDWPVKVPGRWGEVQVCHPHSLPAFTPDLWQWLCPVMTGALARWTLLMVHVPPGLQLCHCLFVPISLGKSGKGFPLLLIAEWSHALFVTLILSTTYSFKPFGMNPVFVWNPNWSIILVEFQRKC